jgi:hypothetical protein
MMWLLSLQYSIVHYGRNVSTTMLNNRYGPYPDTFKKSTARPRRSQTLNKIHGTKAIQAGKSDHGPVVGRICKLEMHCLADGSIRHA